MFPTIVVDYRARGIETSCHSYHPLNKRVLPSVFLAQTGEAHTLVYRNPGDYAWMVVVAPHRILPFGRQKLFCFGRPLPRIGHFFPDQHAESIAPVEPSGIFDLLVLTNAIKAKHLDPSDIGLQRFIGRRGQISVRPVALIQNHFQIGRFSIQEKLPFAQFNSTHTYI